MKQVRTRYSNDFKVKAVEMVQSKGSLRDVSEQLNVNLETLRLWQRAFKNGSLNSSSGNPVKQKSKEEIEIDRLRKELYESNLEKEILKKAVSIFSKKDR